MNTTIAKAEVVNQPVVRLTLELPAKYAAELGGLLVHHVDWEDFPWAEVVFDALVRADIRGEAVFWDEEHGKNVFLRREQDHHE